MKLSTNRGKVEWLLPWGCHPGMWQRVCRWAWRQHHATSELRPAQTYSQTYSMSWSDQCCHRTKTATTTRSCWLQSTDTSTEEQAPCPPRRSDRSRWRSAAARTRTSRDWSGGPRRRSIEACDRDRRCSWLGWDREQTRCHNRSPQSQTAYWTSRSVVQLSISPRLQTRSPPCPNHPQIHSSSSALRHITQ